MKRDMDLVRDLLLRLESLPVDPGDTILLSPYEDEELAIEGHTPDQVHYHLALLYEAGFIESGSRRFAGTLDENWMFSRLSWSGHEFIDTIRDPEVWRRTKERASKAGAWTIGLLTEMGKTVLKQKVKEATGWDL
jgi:hypothetical protein